MLRIHMCEQRSDIWAKVRLGKITASEIHILLGNGSTKDWILLRKAFERLTDRLQQPKIWTPDIQRGIDLEPEAIKLLCDKTGIDFEKIGFLEYDSWSGASPDAWKPSSQIGVEAKCPNEENFLKYLKRKTIRPDHYSQMQMGMRCGNLKKYFYVIYCRGYKPIIQEVWRDEPYIAMLNACVEESKPVIERNMKRIQEIKYINRCSPYYRRNNNFKWRAA